MMRTSIATVSIGGSLEQKLEAIAEAGFDGVEIYDADLTASFSSPSTVRKITAALGLNVELYQPLREAVGISSQAFRRNLDRVRSKLDTAVELGAPTVLACSSTTPESVDDDTLVADQLSYLGDLALDRGLQIAYEALAWGVHVSTYEHSWEIVKAADRASVGVCLDSFHILARGSDLSAVSDIPGDKIAFCQIADAPRLLMDTLSWSRHHRLFPGQGDFPLVEFMERLLSSGYAGPLSIEVFNDVFRQSDPRRTAKDAMRSIRMLNGDVAWRRLFQNGTSFPDDLEALSYARNSEELEFVELAVGERPEAVALLERVGFERVGRHRNKDVELWAHGDARIIVNRGAVASTSLISGLGFSVLATEDQVVQRAELLLAPFVQRTNAPEDQPLVALRAPNGVELFFSPDPPGVDPEWMAEFGPMVDPSVPLGIRDIDHVSLSQDWESFDESVLFYRALAGLSREPLVEVASTQGLVRSVALRNQAHSICVVLNVPPAGVDATSPHQSADHIAFSVDDLVRTVSILRSRGVRMLEIPDNYYLDLKTRTDLSPDRIATFRELSILHDTDGDTAFLQAYTRTAGGIFLEFVQRIAEYPGFGAPNSPVRRAAQAAADGVGASRGG